MPKEALVVFPNNNPPENSFSRSNWPAHATVVPWFKNPKRKRDNVYQDLEDTFKSVEPFRAQVSSRGRTRYNPARGVALLEPEPWQSMHSELMPKIANQIGKLAMLPTKLYAHGMSINGRGRYRPHVTDQKNTMLDEGYPFDVNEVHVIRKSIIPGRRKVVRRFALGNDTGVQPDFGKDYQIPQDSSKVEVGKGFVLDQTPLPVKVSMDAEKLPEQNVKQKR